MTDAKTDKQRSWNMRRVQSADTTPEFVVRSLLHRAGFRFRLRKKELAGKPDIVLPKYKTVIFVHGCFWHRHPGCKRASMPKTNVEKWRTKFEKNVKRDKWVQEALREEGWRVLVVWECEVKTDPVAVINDIISQLGESTRLEYDDISKREILKVADKRVQYKLRDI